jgi:hypothetical protein
LLDLNAAISMEIDISIENSTYDEVDQGLNADQIVEVVLALLAEPVNFPHLEIQPHELNAALPDLNGGGST